MELGCTNTTDNKANLNVKRFGGSVVFPLPLPTSQPGVMLTPTQAPGWPVENGSGQTTDPPNLIT